ncbi:MAG: N-glycosylase/DNA lyase [Acidobacteriota bacterium]|nr:N-glycosylase/DNA lyase [Acidobacteriota bacterium]
MKKETQPITIEKIKQAHAERVSEIRGRLAEFEDIWKNGNDLKLWEEMVFCFFTGGCSAKMGLNSIEAVRPILLKGTHEELTDALLGKHRYPNARAGYIVASRKFLQEHCGMRLREKLESFEDDLERRDWLVKETGIKGLGYKEASHYLRNIGFKGYAILDKHVLRSMAELKIIDDPKPPNNRSRYLTYEQFLKKFAERLKIDFDEMDLVLWSMKTGEILK